jgi:hypothetical protein
MVWILKRIFIIFLFSSSFIIKGWDENEAYVENNKKFLNEDYLLNSSWNINNNFSNEDFGIK